MSEATIVLTESDFHKLMGDAFVEGVLSTLAALDPPDGDRKPTHYSGPMNVELCDWIAETKTRAETVRRVL